MGLDQIDHFVYVTNNLERTKASFENKTGATIYYGGRHLDKGTHNAIFRIGERSYFEILAPDPERRSDIQLSWLGTQNVSYSRISRWCIAPENYITGLNFMNSESKYHFHNIPGRRKKLDGSHLQWNLGLCEREADVDVFPFLIDWGESEHPAISLKNECKIQSLEIHHKCPDKINKITKEFQIDAEIIKSEDVKISILLKTPNGLIEIS